MRGRFFPVALSAPFVGEAAQSFLIVVQFDQRMNPDNMAAAHSHGAILWAVETYLQFCSASASCTCMTAKQHPTL
jgi:hypothetical protein